MKRLNPQKNYCHVCKRLFCCKQHMREHEIKKHFAILNDSIENQREYQLRLIRKLKALLPLECLKCGLEFFNYEEIFHLLNPQPLSECRHLLSFKKNSVITNRINSPEETKNELPIIENDETRMSIQPYMNYIITSTPYISINNKLNKLELVKVESDESASFFTSINNDTNDPVPTSAIMTFFKNIYKFVESKISIFNEGEIKKKKRKADTDDFYNKKAKKMKPNTIILKRRETYGAYKRKLEIENLTDHEEY